MGRTRFVRIACALVACCAAAPAQAAWSPEKPSYGVYSETNVPVTMADGTVLRADVHWPADPATGKAAAGSFPVLLTQTPYGKSSSGGGYNPPGLDHSAPYTGENDYLIKRGFIDVVADVRGTGDSGGSWGLFDPIQADDGMTLARWSAALPHSDGNVGLYGESYLGITQLMTAARQGPSGPIKAIFPVVPGNDLYRDTAFMGGIPDLQFDSIYLALTGGLNTANPLEHPENADLAATELQHLGGLVQYHVPTALLPWTGGAEVYDEAYWHARNPVDGMLQKVVDNGIPAFVVGGWFDLFQRGEPLDYAGLQNLFLGKDALAPMDPSQPVTGRYQLMMGPWYHLTATAGVDGSALMLRWFDRWLKGEPTGIDQTSTPMHLYSLGSKRWVDAAHWPPAGAKPTRYFLNGSTLSTSPPAPGAAADTIQYAGLDMPCTRSPEQWSMGAAISVFGGAEPDPNLDPCAKDDRPFQQGPGAVTYTTAPFTKPVQLAGPIGASIYATSTAPETELVATVEDVAADGTSTPLTSGALLGSLRAVDDSRTWRAPDGQPLLPYHPYTSASQEPVPTGKVVRFDIEVLPTFAEIAAGHSLRLTLTTSDAPHLVPTRDQSAALAGGTYAIQRNAAAPSSIELPLADPAAVDTTATVCPAAPAVVHLGGRARRVLVYVDGKRVATKHGARTIAVERPPRADYTLELVVYTSSGKRYIVRRYRDCTAVR